MCFKLNVIKDKQIRVTKNVSLGSPQEVASDLKDVLRFADWCNGIRVLAKHKYPLAKWRTQAQQLFTCVIKCCMCCLCKDDEEAVLRDFQPSGQN